MKQPCYITFNMTEVLLVDVAVGEAGRDEIEYGLCPESYEFRHYDGEVCSHAVDLKVSFNSKCCREYVREIFPECRETADRPCQTAQEQKYYAEEQEHYHSGLPVADEHRTCLGEENHCQKEREEQPVDVPSGGKMRQDRKSVV